MRNRHTRPDLGGKRRPAAVYNNRRFAVAIFRRPLSAASDDNIHGWIMGKLGGGNGRLTPKGAKLSGPETPGSHFVSECCDCLNVDVLCLCRCFMFRILVVTLFLTL